MPAKKGFKTNKIQETVLFRSTKSYTSLLYGALTVIVLFVIIFLGLRAASQRTGTVTDEAGKTESLAKTYTVQPGDTLWSIAEKNYNDPMMWDDIARANNLSNAGSIEPGVKLTLPEGEIAQAVISESVQLTVTSVPTKKPTPTPTVRPAADNITPIESVGSKITGNTYTVVAGDNLWDIAVRAYGDGFKWIEIAKANKLANPDLIHRGNKFVIPR